MQQQDEAYQETLMQDQEKDQVLCYAMFVFFVFFCFFLFCFLYIQKIKVTTHNKFKIKVLTHGQKRTLNQTIQNNRYQPRAPQGTRSDIARALDLLKTKIN